MLKQKRRSGHSLYDLPWYVFIGAPGSGKTTALVNSGLKFPLEQRSGKGALRGIGGTRNCDWWFTDEALHPAPSPPPRPLRLADLPRACAALVAAPSGQALHVPTGPR